jgi:hypothetical protein
MSGGAMNILHAIDESREEKEKTFSYCAMGLAREMVQI